MLFDTPFRDLHREFAAQDAARRAERAAQARGALATRREVEIEFLPLMRPPPPELGEPKVRAELLRDDVYGQFSRRLASA